MADEPKKTLTQHVTESARAHATALERARRTSEAFESIRRSAEQFKAVFEPLEAPRFTAGDAFRDAVLKGQSSMREVTQAAQAFRQFSDTVRSASEGIRFDRTFTAFAAERHFGALTAAAEAARGGALSELFRATRVGPLTQFAKIEVDRIEHFRQAFQSARLDIEFIRSNAATLDRLAAKYGLADAAPAAQRSHVQTVEDAVSKAEAEGASDPLTSESFWKMLPAALLTLILWVLLNAVDQVNRDFASHWLRKYVLTEDAEARVMVVEELHETLGDDAPRYIRLVNADSLRARAEPRADASVVATLDRGAAVEIVETRGNWTQVLFFVPSSTDRQLGWVASRYLRQVEQPEP